MQNDILLQPFVEDDHRRLMPALEDDYWHLGRQLARRGVDVEALTARAMAFRVAVPSWGVATGGTRFARFAGPGRAADVFEKIDDCEVVTGPHGRDAAGSRCTSRGTGRRARRAASRRGRPRPSHFDSINSNTFQDQPGQRLLLQVRQPDPHRPGRAAPGRRAQPRVHRARQCSSARGRTPSGSATAATSRGRSTRGARSSGTSTACGRSTRRCPTDGACSSSTSSTSRPSTRPCSTTGARATTARASSGRGPSRLVDLGHHAPNVNIEMIVARLDPVREARRLPLQRQQVRRRRPRRRLDQAVPAVPDLQRAGGRRARPACRSFDPVVHARPVAQRDRPDRVADDERRRAAARLRAGQPRGPRGARRGQERNDAIMALAVAQAGLPDRRRADPGHGARDRAGGAIDPVAAYRAAGYRAAAAAQR